MTHIVLLVVLTVAHYKNTDHSAIYYNYFAGYIAVLKECTDNGEIKVANYKPKT